MSVESIDTHATTTKGGHRGPSEAFEKLRAPTADRSKAARRAWVTIREKA